MDLLLRATANILVMRTSGDRVGECVRLRKSTHHAPVTVYQSAGWTFYWSRDTLRPEINTSSSIYTISSVSDSNGGQYRCRAGRGNPVYYTHYSDALWVNVTDNPTAVVSSIKPDVHVFKGENVTLRCDIEAGEDTEWNYIWFKDNNELKQFSRSQEITVRSVTESNSGKYTCRGERKSDSQKSEISAAVTLTVSEYKPRLRVESQSTVFTGDTVTLSCELPQSTGWFFWIKESQYLHPRQIPAPSHTNTVSVTVTTAGETEFQCAVRLQGHSSDYYSDPVKIEVRERPKPTVNVLPAQSVFFGESVTLTCEIQSTYPWSYEWKKAGVQLRGSQRLNQYLISRVDWSHAGDYTCKGTYSDRIYTHTSDSVRLSVSVKPKPTLTSSRNGSVLRGNPVTLYCTLGQSAGWTSYWFRDTESPEIRTSSSIYTISSVSDSNGGQYRCRAGRGHPVYYTHYSDALWVNVTDNPTAVVSSIKPDEHVFKGENVTLRCDIEAGGDTEWNYIWFKDNNELKQFSRSQEITVRSVTESNSGKYTCRGERKSDSQKSEISAAVTLTVSGEAQAVLSVSPQSWLTEGDSVTLSCEVDISSKGWTFSWYRAVPYRQGLTQITDVHGSVVYSVELLSDSRKGAGGSYTLSPAALYHTGVYVCGAERGEPAFHTQYSSPQPLWITGNSPPVSLIISPSRTQHFITNSLSLSCEGHRDSAGWRVRRYTHSEKVSNCSSVPGFTCNISSLSTSDTGVYWCQSESGESSDPVNITVHNSAVILESPVHSVSEGDSLTLRCLNRSTNSSLLPADFYKDGVLLQKQTTVEMTIHKVSKSHEGLYHCKHPEKGESPRSWISVRRPLCPFGNQQKTKQSENLWISGSSPQQAGKTTADDDTIYSDVKHTTD
ncbi:carcinoembryonic antigen-related cell adhesion molecule 5-like [Hoplias malabaricus]|uniref:carcinoembryonic antigen-related cell adhesion molecule 5-like n=1 Tax=Hoplias malabaricus TaxID=27720 RepID=UPI0034633C5B